MGTPVSDDLQEMGPIDYLVVEFPVGSTGREHRGSPLKVWGRREESRSQRCPTAAYHGGWLYCTDSVLALVWRVHSDGQSPAEGWTANPLL
jgi:hypothetical protein